MTEQSKTSEMILFLRFLFQSRLSILYVEKQSEGNGDPLTDVVTETEEVKICTYFVHQLSFKPDRVQ